MKKIQSVIVCVLFFFSILSAGSARAGYPGNAVLNEKNRKEVTDGMKIIKSGTAEFIVPEGTKTKQVGGNFVRIEPLNEYVGRTIKKMQLEIDALRADIEELRAKIEGKETDEVEVNEE